MTMKPKKIALTPINHQSSSENISIKLDIHYEFSGIYFDPPHMLFIRQGEDGSRDYRRLSFEEGLLQPLEMLEPDPAERPGILEMILFHKVRGDTKGLNLSSQEIISMARSELQLRFGLQPAELVDEQ
jgi:hypothetical protein